MGNNFTEEVKAVVRTIPKGSVMTYAEVATKVGSPKAYRAVANIMAANYDKTVPCHRVIRTDGGLGGYNRGGVEAKRALLIREGVLMK
ncbi:MGMT family protein [Candidatus Kaiserbacteria bacterium]|nr:MGMT family protein [Candidatus Kaiserbacteria bacterium]